MVVALHRFTGAPRTAALAIVVAAVLATTPASTAPVALTPARPVAQSPPQRPFLWGAATSSYQVEGGIDCSNPSLPCNDWDFFNRHPNIHDTVAFNTGKAGPAADLAPAGRAVDFWDPAVYKRDLDNAGLLGLNAFRISLEWGRIEPRRDVFDEAAINHYRTMIAEMRERGIEPVVSLNHFTLPDWVLTPPSDRHCRNIFGIEWCFPSDSERGYLGSLRGWLNDETVAEWVKFVQRVVPAFRDQVDYWLTVNEPVGSQVALGYVAGIWSPGFVGDGGKAKQVLRNLVEAHVRAYDAIRQCSGPQPACDDVDANADGTPAEVGFAHAMASTVASPPGFLGNAKLNEDAASNFDYFLNQWFLNAVVLGIEDKNYLDSPGSEQGKDLVHHPEWRGRLDFLGINYYRRFHVHHDDKLAIAGLGFVGGGNHNNLWGEPLNHALLNDLGWTIYPQGLYEQIMRAKRLWNRPVLITENGLPERADRNRAAHLVGHLREVQRAIDDGASVLGYLHWSLMDNWELHEQYRPEARFGLFHVDRANPAQRHLTEGALAYQQVVAESRATSPTGAPTEAAVDAAEERFGIITRDGSRVLPPIMTSGRLWEGTTTEGTRFTLYLNPVKATSRIVGMLYRSDLGRWRRVELRGAAAGPVLREHWHDDGSGQPAFRDHPVRYADGQWTGEFGGSGTVTAARVPGAGTWRWRAGSPWGGSHFAVSKLEGRYAGKFLTFSAPIAGQDEPTPRCGPGGCVPDVSGPMWKALSSVEATPFLRLDGSGREGENLFNVSLQLNGADVATSVARNGGTFVAGKSRNVFNAHFELTGYLSPAGDFTWSGARAGRGRAGFRFLERRGLLLERPVSPAPIGRKADQYHKENDPTSVLPLQHFRFRRDGFTADISWESGGRAYAITDAPLQLNSLDFCFPLPCQGRWSDRAGTVADRLPERFAPLANAGGDRIVEATSGAGARVTLDGTKSLDLDGAALTYRWTGPFGTATGPVADVDLPIGTSQVCLEVSSTSSKGKDCAELTVGDSARPNVAIDNPGQDAVVKGTSSFAGTASDAASGVRSVSVTLRDSSDRPVGQEELPAAFDPATGRWSRDVDTRSLPDGVYAVTVKATDAAGNIGARSSSFTVRNWVVRPHPSPPRPVVAGHRVPIRFTLRTASSVDPRPSPVQRRDLTVRIYERSTPGTVLQESTFGSGRDDYRISRGRYTLRFRTLPRPATYVVEIRRGTLVLGSFRLTAHQGSMRVRMSHAKGDGCP